MDAQLLNIQQKQHIHSNINMFIMIHQTLDSKSKCRSKMDKNTYLINISSHNQLRHCNVPPNHRLVCSSISQQHCHPRARHDFSRNKGQSKITHSQGTQISQTHIVGFIRSSRSQERINAKLMTSNTSFLKHTQPLILLSIVQIPTTAYRSKKTVHSSVKKMKTTG